MMRTCLIQDFKLCVRKTYQRAAQCEGEFRASHAVSRIADFAFTVRIVKIGKQFYDARVRAGTVRYGEAVLSYPFPMRNTVVTVPVKPEPALYQ